MKHLYVYFLQDSATPQMEGLVELHDNIMFYLVIILFGVGWTMVSTVFNFIHNKSPIIDLYLNYVTLTELIWTINHGTLIEFIRTRTPALILILIACPSLSIICVAYPIDSDLSCINYHHPSGWTPINASIGEGNIGGADNVGSGNPPSRG